MAQSDVSACDGWLSAPKGAVDDVGDAVRGFCSFTATTAVLMADGTTKAISEVEVGDWVLAEDPETGERGPRRVTKLWAHEDTVHDLEIDGDIVTTTEDHPFWNVTDGAWQFASDLDPGDRVLAADGDRVPVGSLLLASARTAAAYNLTVDGIHTYFVVVGDEQVLVHNDCGGIGGLARDIDMDELAQLTYQHIGAGDIAGRPTLQQIRTALQSSSHRRPPGAPGVWFEHGGVRVIINEAEPWRSTVHFTGR